MSLKLVKRGIVFNTDDHERLVNRDAADQHPIAAITGLATELGRKYEKPTTGIPNSDLEIEPASKQEFDSFVGSNNTSMLDMINKINEQTKKVNDAYDAVDKINDTVNRSNYDVEYIKAKIERLTAGDVLPGASTIVGEFIPLSSQSTYVYDDKNRVIKEIIHGDIEKEIDYEYNGNGGVSKKIVTANGVSKTATYIYDQYNRLITINSNGAEETNVHGVIGGAVDYDLSLEYNHQDGYVTKMIYSGKINKVVDILYDSIGNIVGRVATYPNGSVRKATYAYDGNGNIITSTDEGVDELYPLTTTEASAHIVKQTIVYGVVASKTNPQTEAINMAYGPKCDMPKVNVLLDDRISNVRDIEMLDSSLMQETPIIQAPKLSFKSRGMFKSADRYDFDVKNPVKQARQLSLHDAFKNDLEVLSVTTPTEVDLLNGLPMVSNTIGDYVVTGHPNAFKILQGGYTGPVQYSWDIYIRRVDNEKFNISRVMITNNSYSSATSLNIYGYTGANFASAVTIAVSVGFTATTPAVCNRAINTTEYRGYRFYVSNYMGGSWYPISMNFWTSVTQKHLFISRTAMDLYSISGTDIVSIGGTLNVAAVDAGFTLSQVTSEIYRKAEDMGLDLVSYCYGNCDVPYSYDYKPYPQVVKTSRTFIGNNQGALSVDMKYKVDPNIAPQKVQDYIRLVFKRDNGDWCNLHGTVVDINDIDDFHDNGTSSDIYADGLTQDEVKAFFDGVNYLEAAILMWPANDKSQMLIESLSIKFTQERYLKECVHGTDYDVAYQSNDKLLITFYKDGDYRVNYYSL